MRKAVWSLLGVLALVLLAGLALWVMRKPLAEVYLKRYCAERDLTCEASVTTLGPSRVSLEDISVVSTSSKPFRANAIEIDLDWSQGDLPRPMSVRLSGPAVRARFNGTVGDLHGLERLIPEGGGGDEPFPALIVEHGSLTVETPAGNVTGTVALSAQDDDSGELTLAIAPVSLVSGANSLDLDAARLELALRDGKLSGRGDLAIAEARLDGLEASDLAADLTIAPAGSSGTRQLSLVAELGSLSTDGILAERLRAEGVATIAELDRLDARSLVPAIQAGAFFVEADRAQWQTREASELRVEGDLNRTTAALSGPLSLEIAALDTPEGTAAGLVFAGVATADGEGAPSLSGTLGIDQASIAPDTRQLIFSAIPESGVTAPHAASLKRALDRALADFRFGVGGELSLSDSGWVLELQDALRLSSATGLELSLTPFAQGPWLSHVGSETAFRGRFSVSGGGAPSLAADVEDAAYSSEGSEELAGSRAPGWRLQTAALSLAPWRVGVDGETREIVAGLERLQVDASADGFRFQAQGRATVSGPLGGVELDRATLFGAIEGVRGPSPMSGTGPLSVTGELAGATEGGWRVQTVDGRCLGVSAAGVTLASLAFGEVSTRLCPEGGRLVQNRGGHPGGTLQIDDLELPYVLGGLAGDLNVEGTRVDWRAGPGGFTADLTADSIAQSLLGETVDIDIDGQTLRASLDRRNGNLVGRVTLNAARIVGPNLPASLTISGVDADLRTGADGISATGTLVDTRIAASGPDPIFEPLMTTQDLRLTGRTLSLSGPIRLATTGERLADSRLDLALPSLTGTGKITAPDLRFRRSGLQPADLSDRLRGLLTNAVGTISVDGDVVVDRGSPQVAATLDLDGLGFQTVALGRVDGVSGTIRFDDLFSLSTPPGQTVRIARINPGIPLDAGTVTFQMLGRQSLLLEAAEWPFAGGQLSVAPANWTIGALENDIRINARSLSLAGIADVFDLETLQATGTVSGAFPISFTGEGAKIRGARLVADGQGGTLKYSGPVADQAAAANETAALAFEALRDFRFTVLEVGADGNLSGDIEVTARLLGSNPDVLYGTPFDFNLSVDSPLMGLLQTGAQISSTGWLVDAAVSQVEAGETDGN